ncbi:hypothetical protein EV1_023841 [Malus domestica]
MANLSWLPSAPSPPLRISLLRKGDDGEEISEVWGGLTIGGWSGVWGVIDGGQRLEERWEWGVGSGWALHVLEGAVVNGWVGSRLSSSREWVGIMVCEVAMGVFGGDWERDGGGEFGE